MTENLETPDEWVLRWEAASLHDEGLSRAVESLIAECSRSATALSKLTQPCGRDAYTSRRRRAAGHLFGLEMRA